MTLTAPEISPLIAQARNVAKPATEADLKWVKPNTLIVDMEVGRPPEWYREPQSPPLPKGYKRVHESKVFMDGVKIHVTGGKSGHKDDYYQSITMANIRYCLNAEGKPVIDLTNSDDHTVNIPLGDQNKPFMQKLADLTQQETNAMDLEPPNVNLANDAIRARDKAIAENALVAGILKEVGAGTTLNNVAFKVAGGAIK